MKVAANILMTGMLLFGFASFAFILQIPQPSSVFWGSIFIFICIACGVTLFMLHIKLIQKHNLLDKKVKALKTAVIATSSAEVIEESNDNQVESYKVDSSIVANAISGIDEVKQNPDKILAALAKLVPISHGLLYIASSTSCEEFYPVGKYAYYSEREPEPFVLGEGINGQAVKDRNPIVINNLPDDYVNIVSGLGKSSPRFVIVNPIVNNLKSVGLCEVGFIAEPTQQQIQVVKMFCDKLVDKVSLN